MKKNDKVQEITNSHDSLPKLADRIVLKTGDLLRKVKTEEDLKIGFEKLLDPIKEELNLKYSPQYERSVYSGRRKDAVHGQVVIEYKAPRSFHSENNVAHAFNQLVDYLYEEMMQTKLIESVGVGFDGENIFFVQYTGKDNQDIELSKFVRRGPYEFNSESARTLLTYIRSLSRVPLSADNLAKKFGPNSEVSQKLVSSLVSALRYWGDQTRIKTFFYEWKRLFGIVYGEQFTDGRKNEEAAALITAYQMEKETDFQELLFSIHTYFAFLMKLISAELLTLRDTSFGSSLAYQLTHLTDDELKKQLEDIEEGGIYSRKGITNFLEGDFFRWYLDAFESPSLKESIREITRCLSEFEPATTVIDPTSTRDLLKKLYQYLVPKQVRHRLGEYYTPDWLAELLIKEVGYDGNNSKRFLDPACGSGTFLVLAIQRAKEWGKRNKRSNSEIAKSIRNNIWGFDLNPLAVIASRTNYLFAMGDLINELIEKDETFEIPVYLCDSILTPTRTTENLFGEFLEVSTSVGKFQIPAEWVRYGGFFLTVAAPILENLVKNRYSLEEALIILSKKGLILPSNMEIVKVFYSQILDLELKNKNGIWARFLKNAFAPMIAGKFDFVVGNPPWIRWGHLSAEYRDATIPLLKKYDLYQTRDFASRNLGVGEKDFSMLFTYACSDYYMKNGSKLGFLITQEVFKSKGAGEGFRRFKLPEDNYLKVIKTHDLVSVKPFEGAANKTAAIIIKKGENTEYPLPYMVWRRKSGIGKIPTDKLYDEAIILLEKESLLAKPIGSPLGSWQTFKKGKSDIWAIEGKNYYQAWRGTESDPYGVHLIQVKSVLSDNSLIIGNLASLGKKKIQRVEERIEKEFIYPAVRGSDIGRWVINPQIYILFPVDALRKIPIPEKEMKEKYPRTYNYLVKFKAEFENRKSKAAQLIARRTVFYAMLGYGPYTVAKYKVLWKRMSNDIIAAVASYFKTPFGYRILIPLGTTSFFSTNDESEAHYLCAIVNSKLVRSFIKSYSSAGRGFGTPSVMKHIGIQKFDHQNPIHKELSDISKKCHQLKNEGKNKELKDLEERIDELIKHLFKINYNN